MDKRIFKTSRVFIILALIAVLALMLTPFCFASDSNLDSNKNTEKTIQIPRKSTNGEGFEFNKIDPDKVVEKLEDTGNELYLMASALSWPIFTGSALAGMAMLGFGLLVGIRMLKTLGATLMFFGITAFVLITFAPEIAQGIIIYIENLFLN